MSADSENGLSLGLYRERVDEALQAIELPREPQQLYDPVRYVIAGDGKRVRPILTLLAAEGLGAGADEAMPAAVAVELFHAFTLVHDDIMDEAPTRRGRPAVHVRWDTPTAILAGDFLHGLAYDQLVRCPATARDDLVRRFHAMVARLCEGQMLDMVFEERSVVEVDAYLDMIDRKTGALIELALELGGVVANAGEEVIERLARVGHLIGRAFQVQDDLLDVVATDASWGKVPGGDLIEAKKAYPLLRALERAEGEQQAWFLRIVEEGGLDPDEVPEARKRLEHLGVLNDARALVRELSEAALRELRTLPQNDAIRALEKLIEDLAARTH